MTKKRPTRKPRGRRIRQTSALSVEVRKQLLVEMDKITGTGSVMTSLERMRQDELRKAAVQFAINSHGPSPHANIIEAANAYYEFLANGALPTVKI